MLELNLLKCYTSSLLDLDDAQQSVGECLSRKVGAADADGRVDKLTHAFGFELQRSAMLNYGNCTSAVIHRYSCLFQFAI